MPEPTFGKIIEAADARTCWRCIYRLRLKPLAVGRIEDRRGLSFQADLTFAETGNRLLLLGQLAKEVRRRQGHVPELVRKSKSSAPPDCGILWDEGLGTIRLRAAITCPDWHEGLPGPLQSLCCAFKEMLENTYLRLAVTAGGGKLCGIPIDLFTNPKYDGYAGPDHGVDWSAIPA